MRWLEGAAREPPLARRLPPLRDQPRGRPRPRARPRRLPRAGRGGAGDDAADQGPGRLLAEPLALPGQVTLSPTAFLTTPTVWATASGSWPLAGMLKVMPSRPRPMSRCTCSPTASASPTTSRAPTSAARGVVEGVPVHPAAREELVAQRLGLLHRRRRRPPSTSDGLVDRADVAADVGAVAGEHLELAGELVEAGGEVGHLGVLGHEAQRLLLALAADHDRRAAGRDRRRAS